MRRPDVVLIAGPTASGKSLLALEVAARMDGEIINADSMQIYAALPILTAQPSHEDQALQPHHLYGVVPPEDSFSVAAWLAAAQKALHEVRRRNQIAIFVGGTGLYFKALEQGLAEVPPIPDGVRVPIRKRLSREGSEKLHAELAGRDPSLARKLKPGDGHRIARALEVMEATGRSLQDFRQEAQSTALLNALNTFKVALMPPRATLHERINTRSEAMMSAAIIDEVRDLLDRNIDPSATIMQAIGVKPITEHLKGVLTLDETTARLQAATRQYAKRQSTWFRGQHGPDWNHVETVEDALAQICG
ncbi:MAG: tRNA (adenosine(37)-N6)-dimethylallyltransferase MiaA [Ahrensia sp.]|nr:tRNA (adenosine(37)-N6)-dimethylallyltransferase MiaA [Ahrensia sp.]